jgi:hypothetical protein
MTNNVLAAAINLELIDRKRIRKNGRDVQCKKQYHAEFIVFADFVAAAILFSMTFLNSGSVYASVLSNVNSLD